jgi:glycosyltransferase involved in cell wall biosynthesis
VGEKFGIHPQIVLNENREAKSVLRVLRQHKVDYILTCDADFVTLVAASTLSIPGLHLFNSLNNIQAYEHHPQLRSLLQKREVYTLSGFLQEAAKTLLGIDADVWHPVIANIGALPQSRTPRHSMTVGYYSSGKHKGDEIIRNIAHQMPHVNFVVAGGRYSHTSTEVPKNVTRLGEISDMQSFYQSIDILLVPSLVREGFSRVIIEAAMNGIPAIANGVGGIPEALGNSGVLIKVDLASYNPNDIAQEYISVITRLAKHPGEYALLSRKALKRAEAYIQEQEEMQERFLDTHFS